MRVLVTPTFARASKKLHQSLKQELDQAIRALMLDPMLGEAKVGDLIGVRVYKFRMGNQLCLLAYRPIDPDTLRVLTFGAHENFYRDLKRVES
jgi:hypothetical protein